MKDTKVLVICFFIFHVFSMITSLFRNEMVSDEYSTLMSYDGIGYILPITWPVFAIFTLFMCLSLFFIYKGNKFGYKLFALMTVCALFFEIVSGIRVSLPFENAIGVITSLLWGAILYDGLISEKYSKQETEEKQGQTRIKTSIP